MGTLWQDIRYGFRMLIRNRGVTVFAMLALGIGISANSTIFSMVNSVLLSPWPFPNPERIMRIGEKRKGSETGNPSLSGPNYLEWGDKCQSFEATCLVTMRFLNLTGGDSNPEEVAAYVWAPSGANVFLGSFEPGLGRFFLPDEDQPGKEHVAILSHGLWRDRYGADPAILGKSIQLDGEPYTVIGVLPASTSVFEAEAKLWLPLPIEDVKKANRSERNYVAFGLLKPGVSVQQARAEMEVIAQNLAREYEENENQEIIVEPMIQNLLRAVKQTMIVMHGAVAFVLLIACSNVASLLLGRATTRQKEMSIRTALGASRMRVVRQMLTESILLSLVGGLLGLLFTVWGIELLKTLLPPVLMEFVTRQGIDVRLLAFTLIISVATGLLFGLVPALRASKFNLNETLKEGGRGSGSRSSSHLMLRFLVVSEIALSLVLLVGAGLMINSFVRLQSVDPGFKSENLMTLHVTLRGSKYDEKHEKRAFYREIVPRIEGIPGVQSVAVASVLPMNWGVGVRFEVDGQSERPDGEPYSAQVRSIHPGYFQALGIPLRKGRYLGAEDDREEGRRIIVSEGFAHEMWPDQDPIGKLLTIPEWDSTPYEVVGVCGDVKQFGLNQDPDPTIYVPFMDQPASSVSFAIRAKDNPLRLLPSVRGEIWALDSNLPIIRPRTMDDAIAQSVAMQRFGMVLLSIFSIVALILSAIGIYGIMAYSVSQRTYEIGIRMALGAQSRDVLRLVVGEGVKLVLIGVVIGLAGAFALTRIITGLLYNVSPTDPVTFAGVSLVLAGVALVASYIPARRATKVHPMVALRYE